MIWKAAVDIFLDNPWYGVGLNMFRQFSSDYDLVVYIMGEPVYIIEAHGACFQIISEMGIFGLIAWSFMLWIPFRSIFGRTKKNVLWPVEESPWIIALQSYSLLLIFYFFLGPLSWRPVESPQIILFFLWLAVISNKDILLRSLHLSKNLVKDKSTENNSIENA